MTGVIMTLLDRPVTPLLGGLNTFGLPESVSFDSDSLYRSMPSVRSVKKKASRLLAAKFLEQSFLQCHLHAHSQESNQTEDQDCPIVHGSNQGDSHHGIPPPVRISRRLDRRNSDVQSRRIGFRACPLELLVVVNVVYRLSMNR